VVAAAAEAAAALTAKTRILLSHTRYHPGFNPAPTPIFNPNQPSQPLQKVANGADGEALRREFKLLVREAHKRGIEVRCLSRVRVLVCACSCALACVRVCVLACVRLLVST